MSAADQYRIILRRDADFWRDELSGFGPLLDAELMIHPTGEFADVVWNEGNGKLEIPSEGVIRFIVDLEEIAAYEWTEGIYCLAITYTNGKRDGSILTGPVEIQPACLPT